VLIFGLFQKFETENGGTKLVLYLDNVTQEELCFTVLADKVFSVQDLKPTPVKVYDYYDRSK
jgi:A-macroglobulin receptor binding domain